MVDPTETAGHAKIQTKLAEARENELVTHRVLLLGTGDSGKTTIIKQMHKIHQNEISANTKKSIIPYLRKKLIQNAQILCSFCKFESLKYEEAREMILEYDWASKSDSLFEKLESRNKNTFEVKELLEIVKDIELVWSDIHFQKILDYRGQKGMFQMDCNTEFFMNRINKVFDKNYIPSDNEYFRFRMRTTGVREEKFEVQSKHTNEMQKFIFIDVGGQRSERKKWLTMVTDQIKSVLYICAISEFDMVCFLNM